MSFWEMVLLLCFLAVMTPVVVYYSAKFGTFAHLRGHQLFRQLMEGDREDDE